MRPTNPMPRLLVLVSTVLVAATLAAVPAAAQAVDAVATEAGAEWGAAGTGPGELYDPRGVATDAAGNAYVADLSNHRVQVFDASGAFVRQWGTRGSGNGQFEEPGDVAVAPSGDVFVADVGNQRIQRFTSTGSFVNAWSTAAANAAGAYLVDVDAAGTVHAVDYVEDYCACPSEFVGFRVRTFAADGTPMGSWNGPDYSDAPGGLAVAGGEVMVTDPVSDEVLVFDTAGTPLRSWATGGGARGVEVDGAGDVYVALLGDLELRRTTGSGSAVWTVGGYACSGPACLSPNDLAVDPTGPGALYVTDSFHRLCRHDLAGTRQWCVGGQLGANPDLRIRKGNGPLIGNNWYEATPQLQVRNATVPAGGSVTYTISVQNDADRPDRIRLKGQGSTPRFTVLYRNQANQNITGAVLAGTYQTPPLAPGATYTVRARVTAKASAPSGASLARLVTARPANAVTTPPGWIGAVLGLDRVRFVTTRS